MITDVIDFDRLIDEPETVQGWCEWEYGLEYSEATDRVIELLCIVEEKEK